MSSNKFFGYAAAGLGLLVTAYFFRFAFANFANMTVLGGILFLEILLACVWKYEQRFFPLAIIAFVWAGAALPLQDTWTAARWAVLAVGALAGLVVWIRKPYARFTAFHLVALFCSLSAFVSATASPLPKMAALKALSLFLLFLYGSAGVRAAVFGREQRFLRGLLIGCEVMVYITAIAYFGLSYRFWGNSNSLGAAMSVGTFPILFWGWFTSEAGSVRWRRLASVLLCTALIFSSLARAGMAAIFLVTLFFCFCLRQYRLLMKVVLMGVGLVAAIGIINPTALSKSATSARDAVLYKGHREEGLLGSRLTPWQKTVSNIKAHPWFGTGYGTSLSGEETVSEVGKYSSVAATSREHGSSYMTIVEWVGLVGVLPFLLLICLNAMHVLKVGLRMRRSGIVSHPAVPLTLALLAGMIHSGFEDSMFAVGSYLCIFIWSMAFMLADYVPGTAVAPVRRMVRSTPNLTIRVEASATSR